MPCRTVGLPETTPTVRSDLIIPPESDRRDEPELTLQIKPGADVPRVRGWARLWAVARPRTRPMLRSGAWYPVMGAEGDDGLVLSVRHHEVRLPAHFVEVRKERPRQFTVVCRGRLDPNPAAGTGRDLGARYAVCPASGHRIRLHGRAPWIECPGCGYRGEVAWHETG